MTSTNLYVINYDWCPLESLDQIQVLNQFRLLENHVIN